MPTPTHKILFCGLLLAIGVVIGHSQTPVELHAEDYEWRNDTEWNYTNTLNYTGSFEGYTPVIGQITIHVVDNLEGDTIGYAEIDKDTIYIENGHSSYTTELICDHEIAHILYDYTHSLPLDKGNDPIYLYSNDHDIFLCDMLVQHIEQQSE